MKLLNKLYLDYPEFTFIEGVDFHWSPKERVITYAPSKLSTNHGAWSLLHELGHGLLGHISYKSDIELVKMEAEAWQQATDIAQKYDIIISEDYIQNCLDTYRDWLHLRSKCPRCGTHSLQKDQKTYACYNCGQAWSVSSSRFCRPYRRSINKKTSPSQAAKAMFMQENRLR